MPSARPSIPKLLKFNRCIWISNKEYPGHSLWQPVCYCCIRGWRETERERQLEKKKGATKSAPTGRLLHQVAPSSLRLAGCKFWALLICSWWGRLLKYRTAHLNDLACDRPCCDRITDSVEQIGRGGCRGPRSRPRCPLALLCESDLFQYGSTSGNILGLVTMNEMLILTHRLGLWLWAGGLCVRVCVWCVWSLTHARPQGFPHTGQRGQKKQNLKMDFRESYNSSSFSLNSIHGRKWNISEVKSALCFFS